MNLKYLLERIYYRGRHPTNTDAKLIWMGLKDHLRNPDNFKDMLNKKYSDSPHYVEIRHLDLPREIKKRYRNTVFSFGNPIYDKATNNMSYYTQIGLHHVIHLHDFNCLHPDNLANNHILDSHSAFTNSLSKKYLIFRHEFEHLNDFQNKELGTGSTTPTNGEIDYGRYFNIPTEVNAYTAEKEHHIERTLIQNRPLNDQYDPMSYSHLPLRKRLYKFRKYPFVDKLNIIRDHTLEKNYMPHDLWFDQLSPEHQDKVERRLSPLINKYMIPN